MAKEKTEETAAHVPRGSLGRVGPSPREMLAEAAREMARAGVKVAKVAAVARPSGPEGKKTRRRK